MSHSTSPRRSSHSRASRVRLALSALAAVAVGGILASGLSAPAFAGPTVTIDVTVHLTSKSGAALTNIKVIPLAVADGNPLPADLYTAATPISGKPGYYDLGSLTADQTYTLEILPASSSSSSAFSQWLGGVTDSQRAETFVPSSTNFISASLATNATITGTVVGPTGKASKGAVVEAYQYEGSTWFARTHVTTNSAGVYSIKDLDPGSYELEFYSYGGAYAPIFSGGLSTLDNATASSASATYVAVGKTATVNAKFRAGTGTITGTAYDNYQGIVFPREYATPVAIPVTSTSGSVATGINFDSAVYGAPSSSKGTWSISNIPTGQYVVKLLPGSYGEPTTYVKNGASVDTLAEAQVYTIAGTTKISTGTTVVGVSDYWGGQLSVAVSDSSSQPLDGATVTAVEESNPYNEYDGTTVNGSVTLGGDPTTKNAMEPGEYDLTVVDKNQLNEPSHTKVYVDLGSNSVPVTLAALTAAPGFTGVPSVTQTDTKVGTTFAAVATATRSDATLSYEWRRGTNVIYGANGSTYTATGADVGATLSVRIIASSFGFDRVYATPSMTGTVTEGDAATVLTDPTISPSSAPVHIGQTLTARPGTWTGTGLHYSYQWTSNGTDVGTNSPTYVVSKTDVSSGGGTTIGVTVQALRAGYADSDWASAPITATGVLYNAPVATTQPTVTKKISGANTVFTVKSGKWSVSGVTLTYTWFTVDQNGTVITATPTTCATGVPTSCSVPTASLSSNPGPLLVQVAASRDGYMTGRTTAVAVKGTSDFTQSTPESVNVTHNGSGIGVAATPGNPTGVSITVGDTLTPTHGVWSVGSGPYAPEGYKYTWYRTVSGAAPKVVGTSSTYKLTASDYNAAISVIETATSTRFGVTSIALSNALALGTVGLGTALADHPATVTLSGSPVAGAVLTAKVGKWPVSAVTNKYAWYGCAGTCGGPIIDTPIAGTGTALKIPTGTFDYVYVVVTGTAVGSPVSYTPGVAVSAFDRIVRAKITKAPTISTDLTTNEYVVTPGIYSPAPETGQVTYAWYVNGVLDTDTTGTTRVVNPADTTAGNAIWVIVTDTVGATTLTTHLVALKGAVLPTQDASITGTNYGQTLAVNPANPFTPAPGATAVKLSYQWGYESGSAFKAIIGATKSTYAPTSAYVGKRLAAKVTGTDADYVTGSVTVWMSAVLGARLFTGVTPATVSFPSAFYVGGTATAKHGNGYPSGTTISYQWQRGDGTSFVNITGATKSTYTATSLDLGEFVRAVVTARKSGYQSVVSTTDPNSDAITVAPDLDTTTDPSIPSNGKVGDTLTANPGVWNTAGLTFTYQWFRNESNSDANNANGSIPGATASTFVLPSSSYGDEISVQVTAHKAGFANVTKSSDVIVVGLGTAAVPTTVAKITSKTVAGVVSYTVSSPAWSVDGLSYSYQWQVKNVSTGVVTTITGATSDTYTRSSGDDAAVGGVLSVVITATRFGYAPAVTPLTVVGPTLVALTAP